MFFFCKYSKVISMMRINYELKFIENQYEIDLDENEDIFQLKFFKKGSNIGCFYVTQEKLIEAVFNSNKGNWVL